MNQVRLLAQDCNYCIDLYLYRCDPDIHVAWGGLRRYLGWVPWSRSTARPSSYATSRAARATLPSDA